MISTATIFAKIILDTQKLHEESWRDEEKGYFTGHYSKDMGQCAKEAANGLGAPSLWYPAMLLCENDWNDIQDWANNPDELLIDPCESCDHKQIDEHHCERGAAPSFAKTLGKCAKQNVPPVA